MKKIAFMFAAAAMVVACGNETKTATQEQKDSLMNLVIDSIYDAEKAAAEANFDAAAVVVEEGQDSATVIAAAKQAAIDAVAKKDTTDAAVKELVAAKIAAFEAELNAPAEENDSTKEK